MGEEELIRWIEPRKMRIGSSCHRLNGYLREERRKVFRAAAVCFALVVAWAALEAWGRGVGVGLVVAASVIEGSLSVLGVLLAIWLVGHLLIRREVCVSRGRICVSGRVLWQLEDGVACITSDSSGRSHIRIARRSNRSEVDIAIDPKVDLPKLHELIQMPVPPSDVDGSPESVGKVAGNQDLLILLVSAAGLVGMVASIIGLMWLGRGLWPGLDVEGWEFLNIACPVVLASTWALAYGVYLLLRKKGP